MTVTNGYAAQGAEPMGSAAFDAPFSDGLTIVVTASARCTVIYE